MRDEFPINFIPTGSLSLDLALGTGGLPCGHITEIYGPDSSGKTTLCLHLLAEAQELGVECALIDVDGSLDLGHAQRCGVKANQLFIAATENAEQALEITLTLAQSGIMLLIVVDSISALVSKAEQSIPYGEVRNVPNQDLISRTLRKLRKPINRSGTAIVFTNHNEQTRAPVYHNLSTNPARLSLKLHSAVRLGLNIKKLIQLGGIVIGQRVLVDVRKNRFSPYHQPSELDIMYNDGIEKSGDLLTFGERCGIIKKLGQHYIYQDYLLGNQESALRRFQEDTILRASIERSIRQRSLPVAIWK